MENYVELTLITLTTTKVLDEGYPILLVTHDEDDGVWQFLCGTTNDPEDGRVVGLDCIYNLDPTVAQLSDLNLPRFSGHEVYAA